MLLFFYVTFLERKVTKRTSTKKGLVEHTTRNNEYR